MAVPVAGKQGSGEAGKAPVEAKTTDEAENTSPLPRLPADPQENIDKVNILLVDDQPANLVAL
jgi:hypothetical protein